jgi:hypothetical protein
MYPEGDTWGSQEVLCISSVSYDTERF